MLCEAQHKQFSVLNNGKAGNLVPFSWQLLCPAKRGIAIMQLKCALAYEKGVWGLRPPVGASPYPPLLLPIFAQVLTLRTV
jgi:hypothetical protein